MSQEENGLLGKTEFPTAHPLAGIEVAPCPLAGRPSAWGPITTTSNAVSSCVLDKGLSNLKHRYKIYRESIHSSGEDIE